VSQTYRRPEKDISGPLRPTKGRKTTNLKRFIADELEEADLEHLYHRPERYTSGLEDTPPRP
jgi:hypothetical protein